PDGAGMAETGFLVVLSGPSGAGKNTIADMAVEQWNNAVKQVMTYTTRPARANEVQEVDYHFVGMETFNKMKKEGFFLESAFVHGYYYGSPKAEILRRIAGGEVVLLVLDIQGGLAVKKEYPETVLVFVMPTRFTDLRARISQRGVAGNDYELRMKNARTEIQAAKRYDYLVINDDLDTAVSDFKAIVQAERCRAYRREALIEVEPSLRKSPGRKTTKVRTR
ncbi:MAG: guanylate kinase, partial [bacterium]